MADLSCCGAFGKYILFAFNLIFWIGGAAILGIGIWLRVDPSALNIFEIVAGDNQVFWDVAIYTLIGLGAFIFLLGFLGCCGAITESRCMLITYTVLIGVVLVAQVTAGILVLVFQNKIDSFLENNMAEQANTKYTHENASSTLIKAWNKMQVEWTCCGGKGFTDYINSTFTIWTERPVPGTCCKLKNEVKLDYDKPFSLDFVKNYEACSQEAIIGNATLAKELHTKPCFTAANDWMQRNIGIILGVSFGVAGLQLLGLILGCCVQCAIKTKNQKIADMEMY